MRILLSLILLLATQNIFSQETFLVDAINGLSIREKPSLKSKRIDKLFFLDQVKLINRTNIKVSVLDEGRQVNGEWFKVKSNEKNGYVFSGFLTRFHSFNESLNSVFLKHTNLKRYKIASDKKYNLIRGDFFGDQIKDVAILVKDEKDSVKLIIIDVAKKTKIYFLGKEDDPFKMQDYGWIGDFSKVSAGEVLWSNYTDDFRSFKDVPENEKVILNYDAIYTHADESCGGGFIFWKDRKFNWLQQE